MYMTSSVDDSHRWRRPYICCLLREPMARPSGSDPDWTPRALQGDTAQHHLHPHPQRQKPGGRAALASSLWAATDRAIPPPEAVPRLLRSPAAPRICPTARAGISAARPATQPKSTGLTPTALLAVDSSMLQGNLSCFAPVARVVVVRCGPTASGNACVPDLSRKGVILDGHGYTDVGDDAGYYVS